MPLTLKYFASLREVIGRDEESMDMPAGVITVADLRRALCARGEPYATVLAEGRSVRAAVNLEMVDAQTVLSDGAEVAFFPPVTGG